LKDFTAINDSEIPLMPGGKWHEVQQGRNELHGMQNEWHCMQVMRGEKLVMLGRPGSGIAAIDARWRCAYRAYALGEELFRGRCRRGFWTNVYSGDNAGEGFVGRANAVPPGRLAQRRPVRIAR